jgi:hypothetical protein
MLDTRIYRAAFLPVLFALLVAAFSLQDRPAALRTTLAPDAFQGPRAEQTLDDLARRFPDRRAGSPGDQALAREIERRLRGLVPGGRRDLAPGSLVRRVTFRGQTLDGERDLTDVIATRPGQPGPGIVVVAHRDAAQRGAKAELSGTAALLELARVAADGRLRRTITFISTTGGSGGLAGAVEAARRLSGQPVDAVLVLGDLAGARIRKPFVVPWVSGAGLAPLQLRRTVEQAVREEVGSEPGGPRAVTQWLREAARLTTSEQGPFGGEGYGAVQISVSGERGPSAGERVVPERLAAFGRAALRSVLALDTGPAIGEGPSSYVVTKKKVLPGWAIRLVGGALLLPLWLGTIDGFARARRRRGRVGGWLLWLLATALPFLLATAVAVLTGAVGLVDPAAPALVPAGSVPVGGGAWAALALVVLVAVVTWLVIRPFLLRAAGADAPPTGPGPASAVAIVTAAITFVSWLLNPFAALLLVPAAHLWLVAVAPEVRLRRGVGIALVVLGLVPLVVVAGALCSQFGAGPLQGLWMGAMLLAGGGVGPAQWIGGALLLGCALAAGLVAWRPPAADDIQPDDVRMRGPITYAGPGSLGGTESALRR